MKLQLATALIASFLATLACALPVSSSKPEELAQTMVVQTHDAAANRATDTPFPATASVVPPPTATSTRMPTLTPVPTAVEHPIQIQDDFTQDSGFWIDCGACSRKSGSLHMGPFPVSGAYQQQFDVCSECGAPTNYRMAADIAFGGGQSDRGFGFLMKGTQDYFITIEITPWQTVEAWKWDNLKGTWEYINSAWTGAVKTGSQPNRLEVEVTTAGVNRSNVAIKVNGKTPLVLFNQPADPGWVGFTIYGHAIEVIYDNFEFQEFEPYGENAPVPFGPGSGG